MSIPLAYLNIWVLDFEFIARDGDPPEPICMVAHDLVSGKWIRLWQNEFGEPPFNLGIDSLFAAFSASAEWSCFIKLGWPMPARCIDLYAEFVCENNGISDSRLFPSLISTASHFGIPTMKAEQKNNMRDLILDGGPWSKHDRIKILEYCEADVHVTSALFKAMLPNISGSHQRLGQALLRGRYTCAVAKMDANGIPADSENLEKIRKGWNKIKSLIIYEVDQEFGVYDDLHFRIQKFEDYLNREGIPWPRLPSGQLMLDDDTFRERARAFPKIAPLRELRHALGKMRLVDFPIGKDGRMRTSLHPYASRTGRNQPSNAKFIFGSSRWLRGLIKPAPGRALAYVDWVSQEIGIAASLSGDHAMWEDYTSGDPYLAFAKRAGFAPIDATKATHSAERQRAKGVLLGVGYGMEADSIAEQSGMHIQHARDLLDYHKRRYHRFWQWVTANQNAGLLGQPLQTTFGWSWRAGMGTNVNPRALLNWPMQANGGEMLRLACCDLTEQGVMVCAPVHDAILIEGEIDVIDKIVIKTRLAMEKASELVLGKGKVVRTDVEVIRYPDRYIDEGGSDLWHRVMRLLDERVVL